MSECEGCAALRERLSRLEAAFSQFGAITGPRDDADRRLGYAIADAVGTRTFTARELFEHKRVDAALRAALLNADIDNGRQLGRLLRRLSWGANPLFEAAGEERDGIVWRVSRV